MSRPATSKSPAPRTTRAPWYLLEAGYAKSTTDKYKFFFKKNHLIVRRRVQQRASKQIQQTGPKSGQAEQSAEQSASESGQSTNPP